MSEQVTIPKSQEETASGETKPRISQPIVELLQEIMQTPREYWPNLLKTIRLFRETVSELPKAPTARVEEVDLTQLSKEERIKRNQGAIALINSWVEEGDEEEQTETAEALESVINADTIDPVQQHQALTKLFQSWRDEGDEEEQTETAEFLRIALDEDRLSNRPLFS